MKILFKGLVCIVVWLFVAVIVDIKAKNETDVDLSNNFESRVNIFLELLGIIIALQSL